MATSNITALHKSLFSKPAHSSRMTVVIFWLGFLGELGWIFLAFPFLLFLFFHLNVCQNQFHETKVGKQERLWGPSITSFAGCKNKGPMLSVTRVYRWIHVSPSYWIVPLLQKEARGGILLKIVPSFRNTPSLCEVFCAWHWPRFELTRFPLVVMCVWH